MTTTLTATSTGADATNARVLLQLTWTTVTAALVQRIHADGSTYPVRGGPAGDGNVPVLSTTGVGWTGYDHEAPLDQAVTYQATSTQAPGTTITSSAVTVASDTSYLSSTIWVTHPLQPALSRLLLVADIPDRTRPARVGVLRVIGRADPVAVTDTRLAGSGEISAITTTSAETLALRALLADGGVLLIRPPGTWDTPWMYVAVGDVAEVGIAGVGTDQWRQWRMPYTAVARPAGLGAGPVGATWNDATVAYATWTALIAGEATWNALVVKPGP